MEVKTKNLIVQPGLSSPESQVAHHVPIQTRYHPAPAPANKHISFFGPAWQQRIKWMELRIEFQPSWAAAGDKR